MYQNFEINPLWTLCVLLSLLKLQVVVKIGVNISFTMNNHYNIIKVERKLIKNTSPLFGTLFLKRLLRIDCLEKL
jgi:hypothetical protein